MSFRGTNEQHLTENWKPADIGSGGAGAGAEAFGVAVGHRCSMCQWCRGHCVAETAGGMG
jgi:hypothetical protein